MQLGCRSDIITLKSLLLSLCLKTAAEASVPVEFNIECSGFSVRPAGRADAKALRMLLPGLPKGVPGLVAVDGSHRLVVGAAAAIPAFRQHPLKGPGIALHVIEPCRRHRIGSSLLAHLEQFAVSAGASALYGIKRVELDKVEMRGWQWLGFNPCETVEEHRLPLEQFELRLAPLVERMRRQGRIPASARIIPLYEANPAEVLRLHLDNMGGNRGELYRKLKNQGDGAFHPRYSRVLLVDDQVKGCILAHRADRDTAIVDANILDPCLRSGWANSWLKLEATRGAIALGISNFQYSTFDQYEDTRSFTKKMGGVTTRTTVLMIRPLTKLVATGKDVPT